ncbi:mandelate racemase/muconate lactonizing enzyme family protein [Pseudonocardia sp. HH130630-07]|uniref:mandelate racemase/muconate lactonizing enzyme family protein n=1 Tax=Pseudonocardia sp. HH130630-07 TaxID=1690815 RepID=UPI0008151258|nr:enolase C-terminal domain-like protein [Pseudonocardia sp. HH130630-07]ANY10720.1 mandelate racemase [Pseudonocardia sp. HH130630-07]
MKIVAVEAIPFAVPYRKPLRFASGEVHTADHVLVRVHAEDGLVGVAEAPPRPYTYGETQASIRAVVDTVFAPELVGLSVFERERIHAVLDRTVGNPTAKAAIDMAVWDVTGRRLGVGVGDLLGGFTDRMRVSHMVGFAPDEVMVAEAQRMRELHGITTFKVKVGRRPIELDTGACRALRTALGPEVELYVDGNRGWTPAEAASALDEMADLGLTLSEELVPADQVLGRRWLTARTRIPTVADESATRPGEITRELLDGAATMISIKTARTGFTGSQRVLHLCEGLGTEVVMGNQIDGQLGTACTVIFGAAHRHTSSRAGELSNYLDMADDLLTEPLRITSGELRTPTGPGLGVSVDSDKLAHYRTDT